MTDCATSRNKVVDIRFCVRRTKSSSYNPLKKNQLWMQLPHVNFSVQVDIISVRDNDKERCAKKIANVGKVASAVFYEHCPFSRSCGLY